MATLYTERLIIVVKAAQQTPANAIARQVSVDGANTFTVGLSPTGNQPATHYWCNWAMTPGERADMEGRMTALQAAGDAQLFDAATFTPEQVLAAMGLQRLRGAI